MATKYAENGDAAGTILGTSKGAVRPVLRRDVGTFFLLRHARAADFLPDQHWLFSDDESGIIYGAYTALVYITPVVGGYLADRYLGQRKAVLFGAVLLTLRPLPHGLRRRSAAGRHR